MSYLKKLIAMVLSILMLCNVVMPVMAATNTEGVTFTATIETPTIEVSDKDQTVVVKITTNKEVVYDSYEADVYIPDGFAIAELKNTVATFEEDSDYFGNLIVYCTANAQNLTTDNLLTITYTIPANTPAGEYDLGVYFWIIGRDWCSDIWEEGAEVTATLTIKDAAPACTHESTKAVSNGNGTHNIVCTNTECGAAVEENVSCTGGTADCETLAQCQYCKASYGSYGGHNYGNLIPAKDAVHTETEQKAGVAAHYQCSVCEKYFDADKNETTYEALAGETPVHSVDPTKTTTETPKAPTCTEEGTEETKYFCSCGKLLRTETKSLPVDGTAHTWGEPSYDWSDDGKTCTATRTCEKDHTHKETVTTTNITSQEIQGVTCSTAGQIEYTATFEEDWAGTDTETLEIPAYHNNNMEYHPFKDAVDCATPGNIEYWYCPGCDACFGDAYAEEYLPYGYIEITLDCERPDDVADCADVTCEICGETIYGYGEHDVLACKGGTCSKCKEEIEGYGCQNYDTPACEDGVCYYCGGFVAGFGHENGAWADCLDGECAYGCGLVYPATVPHVDEDSDDYCDNCWNHLNHVAPDEDEYDPCVGYDCQICWAWVDGQHTGELVYTNNGENHVSYYSCCQTKEEGTTEGHTYDATTHKCICGATNHAHDHYETTETTHQSVCSCGEVLGEAVDHVDGEVLFAGNCQGNAWYKCTVCGENSKGDVNPANHATTATRYTNITATHHTLVHACCGEPIETVAHNKDNYAFEGNCQNPAHYECSCGKEYDGEVNPDVHAAGSTVWYKDITDEQHTAYHPCCQTEIETVNHTYDATTHKCICGATNHAHDHYEITETTHQSVCSCGEVLGEAVDHIDENTDHKCDRNCGKTDMGTHADSATDEDHVCDYGCKAVLEDCSDEAGDGNHNCDVCDKADVTEHTGGTATCQAPANCDECGQPYGEKKADNHTGELVYTNNGENHVSYYSCCQTKEEGTTEGHTYDATTHKCICGATNHAHDHYETTETTHQSVCSCGEVLGEAVDHVDGEVLFAGNCQGNAWYKCTVCGENSKGDVNPANHATTATRYTNITATHHTLVHACCGEPIETVAHNKDNYAFEGNCQIPAHYECSCGKEYDGEVNPNVHAAGSTVWYKDITDEQHTAYHPCCQTEIETVNHTYDAENHKCVCGEVERFTLTVNVLVTYDDVELTVPYGANILEVLAQAVADSKIPALNTPVRINLEGDRIGEGTPSGYTYFISEELGYEDVDEDFTMPAGDFVIVQDYYIFTGWDIFDDNYAYVNENDCIEAGWHYIEEDYDDVDGGAWYYFQYDESYGLNFRAEDITLTTKDDVEGYYAFDHETGKWLENYTGIYTADNGDIYYVENGIAVANKGLVRVVLDDGHVHYYYFGCSVTDSDSHADNSCNAYLAQKNGTHWVENNNGYLVKWDYTFDENGVIVHDEDTSKNGVHKDNGVKFYYIDGVKVHFGLFIGEDGGYYYARSNGSLVVDRTYWISESHLNGVVRNGEPVKEGSYTFDAEGRIVWPDETKDGVFAEDGGLFYYVNGVRDYAGLISYTGSLTTEDGTVIENAYEDAWIYVRTSGELVVGRSYWVTKNNGLVKSATYNFDAEGKMIRTNGFVHEAGGIYYYVNGSRYHAGLIKVDGDYYYVKTSGQVVTGCRYWITHTNGYDVKEGSYEFDADGKMIIPEPVPEKNGIVEENGKLFYYENGKLTYAGLIQYTGDLTTEDGTVIKNAYKNAWIYVRTNGELVVGRSYWITKNNGNMLSGNYTFDEEGVMKNPTA